MAVIEIVKYGAEILTKKIDLLKKKDLNKSLLKNIEQLKDTLSSSETGIGLAAPQIGLSIPVFIILDFKKMSKKEEETKKNPIKVYINPEILESSKECISSLEGCLSIPKAGVIHIYRPARIKVKYLNENFEEVEENLSANLGCVFQHEYDHLQGKLIIDHLKKTKRKELEKKMKNKNL